MWGLADLPDFGEVALNARQKASLYEGSDGSIITLVSSNTSSGDKKWTAKAPVQKIGDNNRRPCLTLTRLF